MLSATVELGHHEFLVTQSFGSSESPVRGLNDYIHEGIARLWNGHFASNDTGNVDVDVFAHRTVRGLPVILMTGMIGLPMILP